MSHIERMHVEVDELVGKIDGLNKFIDNSPIFHTLTMLEQDDMKRQQFYMQGYFMVLRRRLERAEGKPV